MWHLFRGHSEGDKGEKDGKLSFETGILFIWGQCCTLPVDIWKQHSQPSLVRSAVVNRTF